MLSIDYEHVKEYGIIRRRIVNDNDAVKAFQRMTGRITLNDTDVQDLRALGVPVKDVTYVSPENRKKY